MKHFFGRLAVGLGVFLAAAPVVAHHAISAKFDENRPVTLKGLVSKVDWLNPHVHIFIDVQNGNTSSNWAIELESPVDLQKGGWNRDSLKPGDAITVQGISARDGSRQACAGRMASRDSVPQLEKPGIGQSRAPMGSSRMRPESQWIRTVFCETLQTWTRSLRFSAGPGTCTNCVNAII